MTTYDRAYFDSPEYQRRLVEGVSRLRKAEITRVELSDDCGVTWRPALPSEYVGTYEGAGFDRRMVSINTNGRPLRVDLDCDGHTLKSFQGPSEWSRRTVETPEDTEGYRIDG
jgi:hypothetical protein